VYNALQALRGSIRATRATLKFATFKLKLDKRAKDAKVKS